MTSARSSRCSPRSACRASVSRDPTLGESVVVTGLGLIGLITVQLLRANGCRVLGIDLDPKPSGARPNVRSADLRPQPRRGSCRRGNGLFRRARCRRRADHRFDQVEPAGRAGGEDEPQAGTHRAGRSAGLELNRSDFYEKELSFQVSCSYGPGRYDPAYEERSGRTIRSASCAGPSSAISRRCWR